MSSNKTDHAIAVIGGGPAGLYAASQLASSGAQVALLNRDIKPGGLAEYGIYPGKSKMKMGLRRQFRGIMESPQIKYFGNLAVGQDGDISLDELRKLGFSAVLVAVGAQGTKWLGLPGEDLKGVYHAKDLVYHYNQLPPYSETPHPIGEKVVIIGVGNVMMDIAQYAIRDVKAKQVTALARRGPADVKFNRKEMEHIVKNLDLAALDAEIERTGPIMQAVGQDPQAAKDFILSALPKADEPVSDTVFQFKFLAQPKAILSDENGNVTGLEVEHTTLELRPDGETTKAVVVGTTEVIECDTVVFSIGDRVQGDFGLPLDKWQDFAKNPAPRYPVGGRSYEAYDPQTGKALEGIFLVGWAREASSGQVGTARKDGQNGAKAALTYLEGRPPTDIPGRVIKDLEKKLASLEMPVVYKSDWQRLDEIEMQKAEVLGVEHFKFSTNEEMLEAVGLVEKV